MTLIRTLPYTVTQIGKEIQLLQFIVLSECTWEQIIWLGRSWRRDIRSGGLEKLGLVLLWRQTRGWRGLLLRLHEKKKTQAPGFWFRATNMVFGVKTERHEAGRAGEDSWAWRNGELTGLWTWDGATEGAGSCSAWCLSGRCCSRLDEGTTTDTLLAARAVCSW